MAVLLPLPLERAYDYAVPGDLASTTVPGAFVRVPLGATERVGVVWGAGDGTVRGGAPQAGDGSDRSTADDRATAAPGDGRPITH